MSQTQEEVLIQVGFPRAKSVISTKRYDTREKIFTQNGIPPKQLGSVVPVIVNSGQRVDVILRKSSTYVIVEAVPNQIKSGCIGGQSRNQGSRCRYTKVHQIVRGQRAY